MQIFGARRRLRRAAGQRPRRARRGQPGPAAASPPTPACPWSAPATSTTCAPRTTDAARGAALHPDERPAREPEPLPLLDARVLPQDARGDGRAIGRWGAPTCCADARDRRALQRRARARQIRLPRFDEAEGDSFGDAPPALRAGARRALRRRVSDEARARLEFELQTISEMGFADYFLIVWDFIALRREQRHLRRPGPRLGGRLAGRLLPADHRHRPARYDLLFERFLNPGPQVDARHRHRLLGARPRARSSAT